MTTSSRRLQTVTALVFVATVAQLVLATFARGLPQFAGKGFAARLVVYPVLMLLVPVTVAVARRRRSAAPEAGPEVGPLPWGAFALLMTPFLVDVTGNSFNLYDAVTWWDDANHFVNWLLLCTGLGLLVARTGISPRWVVAVLIAGLGALLAVVWEIGEYFAFIRGGTELATAYQDTLGDETLGSLGAAVAGLLVLWWTGRRATDPGPAA